MATSERVTWETCPSCGRSAAVGWSDGMLVEVDCPGGCQLTVENLGRRVRALRSFPPARPPPTTGADARA
jgi:hypothetical protein